MRKKRVSPPQQQAPPAHVPPRASEGFHVSHCTTSPAFPAPYSTTVHIVRHCTRAWTRTSSCCFLLRGWQYDRPPWQQVTIRHSRFTVHDSATASRGLTAAIRALCVHQTTRVLVRCAAGGYAPPPPPPPPQAIRYKPGTGKEERDSTSMQQQPGRTRTVTRTNRYKVYIWIFILLS
jgi:hypothetical protein